MMVASKLSPIEHLTHAPSTRKTPLGSLFVADWLVVSSLVHLPTDDRIGVGNPLLNRVVGEDGSISGKHTTVRYYPTTATRWNGGSNMPLAGSTPSNESRVCDF